MLDDLSNGQFQQTRADQAPFREAGITSQNRLMSLLGIGGDSTGADYGKYGRDFGMSDFQQDPGYAFRLSEGQKALDRSAAARGGLISGGALKAASRYGQDMGSQEYQNAFNRYQINRSNQLTPLQSLMGAGQSATNYVGQAGANNAAAMGNYITGGAAAQAAGNMGAVNALTGGAGAYMKYDQGNNLISALRGNNSPSNAQLASTYGFG
jgi:hypothetical protein